MPASTTSTRSPCCSGEPVPSIHWGRFVRRESLGHPCLHLTRGPSPHPARFSFRKNSETPFSRSLYKKGGNLSDVHRHWWLYLALIRIQKPVPQPGFIAGQTHRRALSVFSLFTQSAMSRESRQYICRNK